MTTKLRTLTHQHLFLNKDRLSQLFSLVKPYDAGDYRVVSLSLSGFYLTHDNKTLYITNLATGEEWRIPNIMLIALNELDIDSITRYEERTNDKVDNLIIIIKSIASNYTSIKFIDETMWDLLSIIASSDLSTKWLRDEIYSQFGIFTDYIIYSSPTEYYNY